jgi:integrase
MPKLWAKSVGERGHRVRIYEARPGGNLMRSVYMHGKEDRRTLGHRDKKKAIADGYALLAQLQADADTLNRGTLTLGALIERYKRSPAFAEKKESSRDGDASNLSRVVQFFGADLDVSTLGPSDVTRYVQARRSGWFHPGKGKPVKVRDATIRSDLVALKTALNWATMERDEKGRRLLKEHPLRGIELPREKNPRRPVMTDDAYRALLEVANQVHPQLKLALVIAEGTGRRLSAWAHLRWDDIDFDAKPFGAIRWRAENDKRGYEQVVPISLAVRDSLLEARQKQKAIGTRWVFPSDWDPAVPTKRDLYDQRLRRAYKLAKLEKEPGSLWHALRRKWATERKGYPVNDLAAAGGWRDTPTLLASYLRTDPETITQVVLNPTMRLAAAKS